VYHCAAPLVADHVANGMYGLILVEPRRGLPPVDREYYVMQSELYTTAPSGGQVLYSPQDGRDEHPRYVVFNGRVGALDGAGTLHASTGEVVRLYVGNAGPNLVSSFHVIGEIFDRVYREGDLLSRAARSVQTTLVPAGGAAVVDFRVDVPGTYTLVDHAIFRTQKGGAGSLVVTGSPAPDIYDPPAPDGGAGHAGH
jgi:nitrite reductase (NO-forming)